MEILQTDKERDYFPGKVWRRSTPEQQGMDPNYLAETVRYIEKDYKNYFSFIVIRNGYLVFESYNKHPYEEKSSQLLKACLSLLAKVLGKPGDTFRDKHSDLFNIRSVTKSIMSILLGIAIDKGYIKSVNDKVLDYLPQCYCQITDERKKNLNIHHLLTMKSGLPSIERGVNAFKMMFGDGDWVRSILDLPSECGRGRSLPIIQPIPTCYLQ